MNHLTSDKRPPYFICYLDSHRAISRLTDAQAGQLYKALFAYVTDGVVLDDSDTIVTVMFDLLSAQIDRDYLRYFTSVENGKKGGASKGNQNAKTSSKNNRKTTPVESKTTPLESKTTPLESKTTPLESKTTPLESKTTPNNQEKEKEKEEEEDKEYEDIISEYSLASSKGEEPKEYSSPTQTHVSVDELWMDQEEPSGVWDDPSGTDEHQKRGSPRYCTPDETAAFVKLAKSILTAGRPQIENRVK